MTKQRTLSQAIRLDLQEKMVFLAGPRQVGKTTLARDIAEQQPHHLYLSWDRQADRKRIRAAQWPAEPSLIILDELHKYRQWKRWIKGEYDHYRGTHRFIVTGSARMDIFRRGGDSLQGRYHHYRLHPFSLNELHNVAPQVEPGVALQFASRESASQHNAVMALLQFSGFPEPILAQSQRIHRRWQKEHVERFFREDVRDLENVHDMSSMQLLTDLLPERVGGLLSLDSLREDLEVSHRAVTHWMDILERLYFLFRIRPFTHRKIRGLKKMPKCYLWDWSLIDDPGDRFENMIASHLLKFCHYLEDTQGHQVELFFLRDADEREVDFLVTFNRKPWLAVEAKSTNSTPISALRYYGERLKIPFLFQVVLDKDRDFVQDNVHVIPAWKFCSGLY